MQNIEECYLQPGTVLTPVKQEPVHHKDSRYIHHSPDVRIKEEEESDEEVDPNRDTSTLFGDKEHLHDITVKDEIGALTIRNQINQNSTILADTKSNFRLRIRTNPYVLLRRLPDTLQRKPSTLETLTNKCCDYTTNPRSPVKSHEMIQSRQKPLTCKICRYATNNHSHLKSHEMIHSGEKPFTCKFCSYTTNNHSHLKSHEMIHSGEKPFNCKFCSYACTRSSTLKTHEMKHSGEKPFACKFCIFATNSSSNLKNHEMIHNRYQFYHQHINQNNKLKEYNNLKSEDPGPRKRQTIPFKPGQVALKNRIQ